jgi:DNA-binding LacI/PurR family transcriptional regulator
VPAGLSLVGYDDIAYAAFTSPPLTTVRQPGRALGEATARLLEARLAGETGPPRTITLEPELVVRGSSAPPAERRR